MICAKCTKNIDDEKEEFFECDGCWAMHHTKCVGVKKSELTARKGSKSLKLFCEKCFVEPNRVMSDNIQKILRYIYKIDLSTQKQEENNKNVEIMLKKIGDERSEDNNNLKEIKQQIDNIKGHIDDGCDTLRAEIIKATQTPLSVLSGNEVWNNNKQTYASVVSADKSLIVLPKKKDGNSERTKQMLMDMIDPTTCGINQIKTLSDGSVLLKCKTNEAIERIEKQVNEKEGENYIIKETDGGERSRVKVVGMSKQYETEELNAIIKNQHLSENAFVRVLKIYADKNIRADCYNAIIEFDEMTARNVLNDKKISVGWDMCKVFKYIRINRCFKCLGFNHMAKDCKNKIACSKCGGAHKVEECKSQKLSCINCVEYAKKNKEKIDTNHHAFAHKCFCTQQIMDKMSGYKKSK